MKLHIGIALAASVLVLPGCSSVSEAVDSGGQALASAGQAVGAADSLIRVGTDLVAACAAAQAAWVPGVSPEDARMAIAEALSLVDGALARAPDAPGAQQLDDALVSAQGTLAADPSSTSLGVSRAALETACALISLGG